MAGKQERRNKGFAGLESLASQVDLTQLAPAPSSAVRTATASQGINRTETEAAAVPALGTAASSSGRKRAIWAVAVILVLLVIVFANNQKETTGAGGSSSPAIGTGSSPPTYVPAAGATQAPSSPERQLFRVPHYRQAELEAERAAAESAQAQAERLAAEVRSARLNLDGEQQEAERARNELQRLGNEIEFERSYVSSTSDQSDIDSFNMKVDRYNMLLVQARRKTDAANSLVDPFNALVGRANHQAQLADQMIDAYNQKLRQYGH